MNQGVLETGKAPLMQETPDEITTGDGCFVGGYPNFVGTRCVPIRYDGEPDDTDD